MFEKKGCQVLLGVLGVLTIIGLMNTGTCSGLSHLGQQPNQQGAGAVIAQLGDRPILADVIDQAVEQERMQQPGISNPAYEFYTFGTAIDKAVNQAATVILAEQRGLKADETVLKALMDKEWARGMEQAKLQLIQNKKLKAGATEKEFVETFKKENGKTPDELKAARLVELTAQLKDPAQGQQLRDNILSASLADAYQKDANVSLDDLKKSFENFNVQRLAFDDPKVPKEKRQETAEKALADLKGGLKFEDVAKKYAPGKPIAPLPYGRGLLENQPDLKIILDLKPGQTSDIIDQLDSPVIYKLVSVTPNLPKDFEKNKNEQLKQYKFQKASEALQKDVEGLKSSKLKWVDPGVEFGYDVFRTQNEGFKLGAEGLKKKYEELVDKSAAVKPTTGLGDKMLTLGKFSAFESYFASLTPEQQKEKREDRTTILQDVLEKSESIDVRMLLYDNLVAAEDWETAGAVLLQAAEYNTGTDENATRAASEIRMRVSKAEGDKKIDKDVLLSVKKELARWEQEKIDANKEQKEAEKTKSNVTDELKQFNDPEAVKKAEQSKTGDKK